MSKYLGYFVLQVNGYAGVDFNGDRLTGDPLDAACQAMRADGVGRLRTSDNRPATPTLAISE